MLAPKLEARMVQELAIKPTDRILEIGTGSGYMTALLAKRGAHVYQRRNRSRIQRGRPLRGLPLTASRTSRSKSVTRARGWDKQAPYDVIVLTGSDTGARQKNFSAA